MAGRSVQSQASHDGYSANHHSGLSHFVVSTVYVLGEETLKVLSNKVTVTVNLQPTWRNWMPAVTFLCGTLSITLKFLILRHQVYFFATYFLILRQLEIIF